MALELFEDQLHFLMFSHSGHIQKLHKSFRNITDWLLHFLKVSDTEVI